MANESNGAADDFTVEERIARHIGDFGPAFGDKKILKSIISHYPEIDLSSIRVARELGFTHALLMGAAEEYFRPAGLSWSKLFILLWLRAIQDEGGKGLNPSELSDHLAVTRNTISTLLGGLERQGYITRELDPEDKRRFVIRLTSAGSEVVQRSATPLFSYLQVLLSSMDKKQHVALIHGLMELQRVVLQNRPELAARCLYHPFRNVEEQEKETMS